MKFLKKASLAAAIAAASISAQAGMVALDDETMAATTGQAGVTIEINIGGSGITVGEIEYKDEGSVLLQNLSVNNVNNLTQKIDVDSQGNLQIEMSGVANMRLSLGDVADSVKDGTYDPLSGAPRTGNGSTSAVALRSATGETTELVNNLDMTLNLGESKTTIYNMASSVNQAAATLNPTDPGYDAALANMDPRALQGSVAIYAKTSLEITDMNVGAFGYTRAQAMKQAGVPDGTSYDSLTGVQKATVDQLASGSAVQIEGLKFYGTGGVGTAATIEQTIWAKGGTVAQGGGVYIQLGEIAGTLDIAGIRMGGESIGSVKVSDINLAGMTQRIYGHN